MVFMEQPAPLQLGGGSPKLRVPTPDRPSFAHHSPEYGSPKLRVLFYCGPFVACLADIGSVAPTILGSGPPRATAGAWIFRPPGSSMIARSTSASAGTVGSFACCFA
jgi:hypothetical protein